MKFDPKLFDDLLRFVDKNPLTIKIQRSKDSWWVGLHINSDEIPNTIGKPTFGEALEELFASIRRD